MFTENEVDECVALFIDDIITPENHYSWEDTSAERLSSLMDMDTTTAAADYDTDKDNELHPLVQACLTTPKKKKACIRQPDNTLDLEFHNGPYPSDQ